MPGRQPAFRAPQLATLAETVPSGADWMFEMKHDGYRCLASISGRDVTLYTRNGHDWTHKFASLVEPFAQLTTSSALIDGEICALLDDGRSDFSTLTSALKNGAPLVFYAFDLLELNGEDLASLPLFERKERLEALLTETPAAAPIRFSSHVLGNGQEVFDAVCREGHEGVIAKRAMAKYRGTRTKNWLKLKCGQRQEFVIAGFSPSSRKDTFASLLLGSWDADQLVYRGRVGTGFTVEEAQSLQRELDARVQSQNPFAAVPREISRSGRWVDPVLVAEIAFTEFTPDGVLRHPSFLGLRKGGAAAEASHHRVDLAERGLAATTRLGLRLTSPSRVAYPEHGVSKAAIAGYYDAVAERMLPFIANRPLSLLRCPQGRTKHCFFQKHDSGGFPDEMARVEIAEKDGAIEQYFFVRDLAGLIAGVQMNVLEWHIWGSCVEHVEQPERLVFDLDPDETLGFADVRDAARTVASALEDIGLRSFPMLSGGKGIHVIVPIVIGPDWSIVKRFTHDIARQLAAREPQRFVASMSKARRKGKMFVDYLRNSRGATAIAPWSTRARSGATVAVPVRWADLDSLQSGGQYSVYSAAEQAQSSDDPWPDYFTLEQHMPDAMAAFDAMRP